MSARWGFALGVLVLVNVALWSAPRIASLETQVGSTRVVGANAAATEYESSPPAQPTGVVALALTPTPCCVAGGVPLERLHQDADTGRRWVTDEEFEAALASSPWPRERWPPVVAIARCESPANVGGQRVGIALDLVGAWGEVGPMQVLPSAHGNVARAFDLGALGDNLAAAYVVFLEAGSSFGPWSCR